MNSNIDSNQTNLDGLYSAVVADVLDSLGYRNQCLDASIRSLCASPRVAGRVFTARAKTVDEVPEEPYKLEMKAVDSMQAGDVLVCDVGFDRSCGFWGELLTTACLYKGVNGVVMTACTRDLWKLKEIDFPVFGIGYHPADSKGRTDIVAINEPIEISGVTVRSGDLILGDEDGVVVIPEAVIEETLRLSREKVSGENVVRTELANGMPITEAFAKYGIL
jgi:4-hydroxy-4-methyl-2-oxoglutarate aldolase